MILKGGRKAMNCPKCNALLKSLFTSTYCAHCERVNDAIEKRWWTVVKSNRKIGEAIDAGVLIVYDSTPDYPDNVWYKKAWVEPIGKPEKIDQGAGYSVIGLRIIAFVED